MNPDDLRFSSVKEDRDWYFVEYSPPFTNWRFSILQLSVVEPRSAEEVATAMEREARDWLRRYAVPLMATAFSVEGDVLPLENVRRTSHLMAWVKSDDSAIEFRWEIVQDKNLPDVALDRERIKQIFADVPFRTLGAIREEFETKNAKRRVGWWFVFLWAVVVPLGVAIVEWSSEALGLIVLGYAFIKAIVKALRLTGRLPKSKRQAEREAEDLKMRHHHHHCGLNPEAFALLRAENFRRQEVENTKAEVRALKKSAINSPRKI